MTPRWPSGRSAATAAGPRLHRLLVLARPRVPRALRPAARQGSLVVSVQRRAGVRNSVSITFSHVYNARKSRSS